MKRKILTSLLAVLFLAGLGLGVSSCSSSNEKIEETQWKIVNIKVNKGDWKWVADAGQYEVVVNLPELTQFIFNEGAVIAYLKIDAKTKAQLPFSKSYTFEFTAGDGSTQTGTYTEHIKCDFQVGSPSSVAFFIEASDLQRADEYLEDKDFQVVMIW